MAVDRNSIDKLRKANNQEPLTDAEFDALNGVEPTDEQKLQAQAKLDEEKRVADEAAAEALRLEEEKKQKEVKPREYTDEELLELVAKKTGRKAASWDDLKPSAEIIDKEKAKAEREDNKFSWGLQTKQFKKDEYEGFITDSKDAKSLVYRQRLQAAKKDDPNLDENEFEEEFNEEFGINAQINTRRYKNGQDTLNRIANDILKSSYSSIYELDNKYSAYEKEQAENQQREAKIKEGAPAYKKSLDTIKGQLKKIKEKFTDTDEYEVEVLDESIDKVLNMMSDPAWASQQILNGYSEESLRDVAWTTVLKENFPALAMQVAKQHLYKHAAGTKGIPKIGTGGDVEEYELTEQQQVLKSIIEKNKEALVTAN